MISYGIVTHGGVGGAPSLEDGCRAAAERGFAVLERGGHALDAVEEAAAALEDDGRYNAGRGAVLRLDGRTVERDASLMDSEGRLGAVAAVPGVRNPVRLARRVTETPHVLLAGKGAWKLAARFGLAADEPPTPEVLDRLERTRRAAGLSPAWRSFDVARYWNFDRPWDEVLPAPDAGTDTIGAVALDRKGRFASANSTGGASPMLAGRVGDAPLIGCGFYAGSEGAVAATGLGEEIIRRMLSRRVYDALVSGWEAERAAREGMESFPSDVPVGIIAISRRGHAVAHNRAMPSGFLVQG